jgi:hypothetical protein
MGEIRIPVPPDAGTSEKWGDWAILREPPEQKLNLDLDKLRSADPLFLLRLRGFIDWHCGNGNKVRVTRPGSRPVRDYLARMGVGHDLPDGCVCDLGDVPAASHNDVMIPIKRLISRQDSDELDYDLETLYNAHFDGELSGMADAFTRTVSEMCDNATTHGRSKGGAAYVTAQRYRQRRCVLAVGDFGIGVPEHIRQAFPDLVNDDDAIREATKEGVTATGNPHRGIGYQYVIDGLKESNVPMGELRIWSGRGRFRVEVRDGIQVRRRAWAVDSPTVGTWVRLELAASS